MCSCREHHSFSRRERKIARMYVRRVQSFATFARRANYSSNTGTRRVAGNISFKHSIRKVAVWKSKERRKVVLASSDGLCTLNFIFSGFGESFSLHFPLRRATHRAFTRISILERKLYRTVLDRTSSRYRIFSKHQSPTERSNRFT